MDIGREKKESLDELLSGLLVADGILLALKAIPGIHSAAPTAINKAQEIVEDAANTIKGLIVCLETEPAAAGDNAATSAAGPGEIKEEAGRASTPAEALESAERAEAVPSMEGRNDGGM